MVDANSGNTLHAANADALRHPASLTKIMTLYLLFEQIEAGKLRLDSRLEVSEHASEQAPSKLGLRPGQTLSVEDAIRALVTKSANDAAAVVAEAIGGDEETFGTHDDAQGARARHVAHRLRQCVGPARRPTRSPPRAIRPRSAAPSRTASRATIAISRRRAFVYHGRAMRNHNKLLGRVEGVDGIKTGYTRMSGFNLVSSVKRDGHHIVAVVLGGSSGGARDARMRSLIEQYIDEGSAQRTVAKITEAGSTEVAAVTPKAAAPALQVQTSPQVVAQPAATAPRMSSRADDDGDGHHGVGCPGRDRQHCRRAVARCRGGRRISVASPSRVRANRSTP